MIYLKEFINYLGLSSETEKDYYSKITLPEYKKILKGEKQIFSFEEVDEIQDFCYYSSMLCKLILPCDSRGIVTRSSMIDRSELCIVGYTRVQNAVNLMEDNPIDYKEKNNIFYKYTTTINKMPDDWYMVKDSRSCYTDKYKLKMDWGRKEWTRYYKVDQYEGLVEFLHNMDIV